MNNIHTFILCVKIHTFIHIHIYRLFVYVYSPPPPSPRFYLEGFIRILQWLFFGEDPIRAVSVREEGFTFLKNEFTNHIYIIFYIKTKFIW